MFIGFSVSTCGYSLKILFIENFKHHHPPFVNLCPLSFIKSKLSRCCSIMSLISLSLMFLTVLNQAHKPVISCIILTSPVKCLFSSLFRGCWYLFLKDCKFTCLVFPFIFSSFLWEFWDGYLSVFVSHFLYTTFHSITPDPYFILLRGEDMPQDPQRSIFFNCIGWFPWLYIPFLDLLYPPFNWVLVPYMK